MRAGNQTSYTDYPFYTTIDLKMVSEKTSYTDSGEPLFYLYPLRFDKRLYYDENRANEGLKKDITEADKICKAIGDGWRLPNANELIPSSPAIFTTWASLPFTVANSSYPTPVAFSEHVAFVI